jgi:ribosomal protein S18 acetylase RimI-like enzyme
MPFSVRAARTEDAPAIAAVHMEAQRDAMPYLPELHSAEETLAWAREVVLENYEVTVAEADGRVVGYAALSADVLEQLYVLPAFQGIGVGSSLLDLAKRARPDGVRLWVFQRNAGARRFYEARGFRLVQLTDGADNEEGEPDALYEWRPTPPARATTAAT